MQIVVSNFPRLQFTLPCSYPKVKQNAFIEKFKSNDWFDPIITEVMANPLCYPKIRHYVAYILILFGKNTIGFEKEQEELLEIIDIIEKNKKIITIPRMHLKVNKWDEEKVHFKITKEAYKVLSLSGDLKFPIHQLNNYFSFEQQSEVLNFLIEHRFDINELCDNLWVLFPLKKSASCCVNTPAVDCIKHLFPSPSPNELVELINNISPGLANRQECCIS